MSEEAASLPVIPNKKTWAIMKTDKINPSYSKSYKFRPSYVKRALVWLKNNMVEDCKNVINYFDSLNNDVETKDKSASNTTNIEITNSENLRLLNKLKPYISCASGTSLYFSRRTEEIKCDDK